jgi:hypothetical protein
VSAFGCRVFQVRKPTPLFDEMALRFVPERETNDSRREAAKCRLAYL